MATENSIPSALRNFTASVSTVVGSLPEADSLLPPGEGITLLDAKNEIFLSYLQTLALRNLEVIRGCKRYVQGDGVIRAEAEDKRLRDAMVKKLVEHRVYLEKGVRPLEDRIKYQVDKVIRAADDEIRVSAQKEMPRKKLNGQANGKDATKDSDSDEESDASGGEADAENDAEIDPLSYRPDPAAFLTKESATKEHSKEGKRNTDGVYRPPRISATSMPSTESRERKERKPRTSATMDEYISTELSTAPIAEPSIGSTITAGGRKNKSARQLAEESERREYEETNLVRLPQESKKDRQRKQGGSNGGFGGEEWRGLGESVDRIGDLTRKKSKDSALDKSRKRHAVEDGPRDSGVGGAFDVKKRRMMKKSKR